MKKYVKPVITKIDLKPEERIGITNCLNPSAKHILEVCGGTKKFCG